MIRRLKTKASFFIIFTRMAGRDKILKIAIVGPESTGKSTLSRQLAEYYHTVWVPEYSREYCASLIGPATLQDELNIFSGQLQTEDRLIKKASNILICDTTILTVKIWCDYLFKTTPQVVLNELKNRSYDFYLLMDIDLPWEDDPLRDFPHLRVYFLDIWKIELSALNASFKLISGNKEERFRNAINAVEQLNSKKETL